MARFFALVTAVLAAATVVSGQLSSPIGNTYQPGRGAALGTAIYYPDTTGSVIIKLDTATGAQTIISGKRGTTGVTEGNSTDNAALWKNPEGLCTDGTDLFVADTGNHKLRKIVLASGQTSTVIGSGTAGDAIGTGVAATLNGPTDCQFVGTANVYVADAANNKIKKVVAATGVTTVLTGPAAGTTTAADYADGTTANNNARFRNPTGLCTDGTDLFVADTGNHGIRKVVVADGTTSSSAGGTAAANIGFIDHATTPANVRFNGPTDCHAHSGAGIILVADKNNHAVRRVTSGTGSFQYIGQGVPGDHNGAAGIEGQLFSPIGIVGDGATQSAAPTNHYILEQYSEVRKAVYGATTAGALSTVGGTTNTVFPENVYACVQMTDFYCTDPAKHVVWKVVAGTGVASVFAGTEGTAGDADGAAGTGKLNGPTGIATDGTDFVVSDTGNHKLRRLVAAGTLSTPAGFGAVAGCYPSCAAGATLANSATQQFNTPKGLAYRAEGTQLFIADSGNHRIVKQTTFAGAALATTFAGTSGTAGDANGAAGTAQFRNPEGVCHFQANGGTATEGAILIMDTGNNKVKATGTAAHAAAIYGMSQTAGTTITMFGPAADGSTLGGDVSGNTGANQRFRGPRACACQHEATTTATFCVIADTGNNKLKKIVLDATDTSKTMTVFGGADGTITAGNVIGSTASALRFNSPSALARLSATSFLATDSGNRQLKTVSDAGVTAGGPAADIYLSVPAASNVNTNTAGANPIATGTAPSADGNIALFNGLRDAAAFPATGTTETWYVTDTANHAIRRVVYNVTSGLTTVSTFLGTVGTSGDVITSGSVAFNGPTGIVANGTTQLYVADSGNNKIKLITIAADGTPTVTIFSGPVAGTTTAGDTVGANAAATAFTNPQGLAIWNGDLYVADTGVNKIKKITAAGVSSAFAGGASGNTDGAVASALFAAPRGLAANGTFLVVADTGNHRIRQCTTTTCSTFAGAGAGTTDGSGVAALFNSPWGVNFDQFGNLYVADTGNHKIRKATPAAAVTSVVGTAGGSAGVAGLADQATATSAGVYATATLSSPSSVFFSRLQPTLGFIGDTGNNRVRAVVGLGTAAVTATATATSTNTTTTTMTNTSTVSNTTAPNTTTVVTTAPNTTTTVAPTTTRASNAVVAAATAVVVAVLAIFA